MQQDSHSSGEIVGSFNACSCSSYVVLFVNSKSEVLRDPGQGLQCDTGMSRSTPPTPRIVPRRQPKPSNHSDRQSQEHTDSLEATTGSRLADLSFGRAMSFRLDRGMDGMNNYLDPGLKFVLPPSG